MLKDYSLYKVGHKNGLLQSVSILIRFSSFELYHTYLYQRTERVQDKHAALCPHLHFNVSYALEHVKLHKLHKTMLRLHTLMILNQVYLGSKICPDFETLGPPGPARYSRRFSIFIFFSSSKKLFPFFIRRSRLEGHLRIWNQICLLIIVDNFAFSLLAYSWS